MCFPDSGGGATAVSGIFIGQNDHLHACPWPPRALSVDLQLWGRGRVYEPLEVMVAGRMKVIEHRNTDRIVDRSSQLHIAILKQK